MKQHLGKITDRHVFRKIVCGAFLIVALLLFGKASTVGTAQNTSNQTYVVAFQNTSGLPSNVDDIVAAAGGTTIAKMPEIGGIAATSANPNFIAQVTANATVKSADVATATALIEPQDPSTASADNNGGSYSPTGSDTQ